VIGLSGVRWWTEEKKDWGAELVGKSFLGKPFGGRKCEEKGGGRAGDLWAIWHADQNGYDKGKWEKKRK